MDAVPHFRHNPFRDTYFQASIFQLDASAALMRVQQTAIKPLRLFVVSLAFFLMFGEWILLVAGTRRDEMIVGAISVLASGAFLFVAHSSSTLRANFRVVDMFRAWRIPWYIASDIVGIAFVLFKDLFGIEKAKSLYRVSGFRTAKDDPVLVARRVLAIAYTSVSPNSIVLGIDYKRSRMLFHQVTRSHVAKMTEELGAKP